MGIYGSNLEIITAYVSSSGQSLSPTLGGTDFYNFEFKGRTLVGVTLPAGWVSTQVYMFSVPDWQLGEVFQGYLQDKDGSIVFPTWSLSSGATTYRALDIAVFYGVPRLHFYLGSSQTTTRPIVFHLKDL